MELNFEKFNIDKDIDKQRALFADAFAEVEDKSLESYYWQFHQYPNIQNCSYEYCAFIDEEIVGYYAAVPYRYKIGDKNTDVGMVCGVMTSTQHQGKGIFTRLGRYATNELSKNLPFTTGYPIRKAVIPGHLKVGWKVAFELPLYMKFVKLNSLFKSRGIPLIAPLLNPFLSLYNAILSSGRNKFLKSEFYSSVNSIEGYDDFVEEWIEEIPNVLIKDRKFANWRYGKPGSKYQFLVIRKEDKIIGLTVFSSIIKEGVPSYCLLDLMFLSSEISSIGFLYKELYRKAKIESVEAIMFMMSKHSAKRNKVLRNGFIKSPFKFFFIIKNLTGEFRDEVLFKEENWHLMWVDSDDL